MKSPNQELKPEFKPELTKEADVANMMRQIKALEGVKVKPVIESQESKKQALVGGDSSDVATEGMHPVPVQSPQPPPPITSGETAALPSSSHSPPATPSLETPKPPAAPGFVHDLVEVVSKESRHYGVVFRLGVISEGRAHGYILKEGGARDYITVGANQIGTIGKPKVKAKQCCSPQWMSEHGEKP